MNRWETFNIQRPVAGRISTACRIGSDVKPRNEMHGYYKTGTRSRSRSRDIHDPFTFTMVRTFVPIHFENVAATPA